MFLKKHVILYHCRMLGLISRIDENSVVKHRRRRRGSCGAAPHDDGKFRKIGYSRAENLPLSRAKFS